MSTQPALPRSKSEQLKFCEPAICFSTDAWLDEGKELEKYDKDLENRADLLQWDIGDWLLKGEEGGVKTKALKAKDFQKYALKITKRKSWGVLKNLKSVAANVEESRRRDGREGRKFLSYSMHVEIAKFDDEKQEELLQIAEEGYHSFSYDPKVHASFSPPAPQKVVSVSDLQRTIAIMQERGELPMTPAQKRRKEKAKEKWQALKIRISDDSYKQLERLSNAKYGKPYGWRGRSKQFERACLQQVSTFVSWMAAEYYKEHRAELEAMVAGSDVKDAAYSEETSKAVVEKSLQVPKVPDSKENKVDVQSVSSGTSRVRVATSLPKQYWMQAQKLDWLDKAIADNPCDLFLTPQEFVGGGSTREWCRLKGFETDDVPVTESWLLEHVGSLGRKHGIHIGFGATVNRDGILTEDYLYYDPSGTMIGYSSKIALPVQDSVVNGGASQVTPEVDPARAAKVIEFESEFKQLPIAVTCNSWDGGEKFLALVGWVDETTRHTDLHHLPSTAEVEKVVVTSYDPTLYAELEHLSLGVYGRFKPDWKPLMAGTMRRKAVRIEQRVRDGRAATRLEKHVAKKLCSEKARR